MFNDLYIDGELLPEPAENLKFANTKTKTEGETEAGTTMVIVTRTEQITISGKWNVTGSWLSKFRAWAKADTVAVKCYFPEVDQLTEHTCQLTISNESHERKARSQLSTNGLYEVSITLEEL